VDAVKSEAWKNAALFLRYPSAEVFKTVFRGAQFREMARIGTAWARTSEALRHQEAVLGERTGTPVEILPVKFESLALSAQMLAQDIALVINHATENQQSVRRVVQHFRDDAVLPNPYIKGFRIRVKGKLTAGMASGFVLQGGSTHTTSFSAKVDTGVAHAQTRIGIIGVKVWLVYHQMPWSRSQRHMQFWQSARERE